MAKKAAGTPATALLTARNVAFGLHPYEVSPDAPNYGALVAEALGVAPEAVFKTLIAEVAGALTVGGCTSRPAGGVRRCRSRPRIWCSSPRPPSHRFGHEPAFLPPAAVPLRHRYCAAAILPRRSGKLGHRGSHMRHGGRSVAPPSPSRCRIVMPRYQIAWKPALCSKAQPQYVARHNKMLLIHWRPGERHSRQRTHQRSETRPGFTRKDTTNA
jgi:hypothetical protein